jgi:hypothetical protein
VGKKVGKNITAKSVTIDVGTIMIGKDIYPLQNIKWITWITRG